jgi:hypothetical protein
MMHVKFYAISVLFLIAVGACFLLIAFGQGPDSGIAADNDHSGVITHAKPLTENSVDRVSSEQVQPGKEPRVLRPGL